MTPLASVVIRAKDEALTIGTTLGLLHSQTVADRLELIVVDSGSSDGTVALARDAGARVIEIPAASFTFGGALNRGCAEVRAPLAIALSAHALPRDEEWAARMLAAFADSRVACAKGQSTGPDGELLAAPLLFDLDLARRHPLYGYSNHAGGFRMDLWRRRPFREDMPGCEDKEWGWHWLQRGMCVLSDPSLDVEHDHSRDPVPDVYRRSRREQEGYAMFLDLPPYRGRDALRDWLRGGAGDPRARLSPRRAARVAGTYAGRRRGQRQRGAVPSGLPRE